MICLYIDNLIGFYYNNDKYYYIKNNLDDIIGILDSNYNVVAKYTYDSWGTFYPLQIPMDCSDNPTSKKDISDISVVLSVGFIRITDDNKAYLDFSQEANGPFFL